MSIQLLTKTAGHEGFFFPSSQQKAVKEAAVVMLRCHHVVVTLQMKEALRTLTQQNTPHSPHV